MQPIPIPDDVIKRATEAGWKSQVIAGPDGDLTSDSIRPVDALTGVVEYPEHGVALEINVLCQIDAEDMALLQANDGLFWITFTGSIVPFSLSIFEPEEKDDRPQE